jgi:hypothetical protein
MERAVVGTAVRPFVAWAGDEHGSRTCIMCVYVCK